MAEPQKFPLFNGCHYGDLRIEGGLRVEGPSTFIKVANFAEMTDTYIRDNIITLNYGEATDGVLKNTSGFEVSRGPNLPLASILYNESQLWFEAGFGDTRYPLARFTPGIGDTMIPIWDSANSIFKTLSDFTYSRAAGLLAGTAKLEPVALGVHPYFTHPGADASALTGKSLIAVGADAPTDVRRLVLLGAALSYGEIPNTSYLDSALNYLAIHAQSTIDFGVGPGSAPGKTDTSLADKHILRINSSGIETKSLKISAPAEISLINAEYASTSIDNQIVISPVTSTMASVSAGIQVLIVKSSFIGSGHEHRILMPIAKTADWTTAGLMDRLTSMTMLVKNITDGVVWAMPTYNIRQDSSFSATEDYQVISVDVDTIAEKTYNVVFEAHFTLQ
jgi:hypothetical protein